MDDAYLYRFSEDEYMLVVNASNRLKDWEYFQTHLSEFNGVALTDRSDEIAMIALQAIFPYDFKKTYSFRSLA